MPISPYNANAELVAMKDDIANRNVRLKIKTIAITGAVALAGAAAGGALLAPMMGPAMAMVAGGGVGAAVGKRIGDMATLKERTKLQIDEDMTHSYMQGKNYWGKGYREEVAEYGYAQAQPPALHGAPPPRAPRQIG